MFNAARAKRDCRKAARQFARSVQFGKTYYSIAEITNPWGDDRMVREWVFDRRHPVTGDPMCGPTSAEGAWLTHGPLTDKRPAGLRSLFDSGEQHHPDPEDATWPTPKAAAHC